MRKRTEAREAALKILYAWDITGEPISDCCRKFWDNNAGRGTTVMKFSEALVMGVDRNIRYLDEIITRHATNWKLDRMATIDRNVLRMAVFELMFVPETPTKVVINEAIEMAKKYGDKDSGKFVNGILDKVSKTEQPDRQEGETTKNGE